MLRGPLNDLYLYEIKARGEQRFSSDLLRVWRTGSQQLKAERQKASLNLSEQKYPVPRQL